jgi:hypothetical protein
MSILNSLFGVRDYNAPTSADYANQTYADSSSTAGQNAQQAMTLGAMQQNQLGVMQQGGLISNTFAEANFVDPNNDPVFQMPLQDAHTLWAAKFGTDRWVSVKPNTRHAFLQPDTEEEFNWEAVTDRLRNAQLLERHISGMYRFMEHQWKS